jgi:small subunit ribosomal protein S17
MEKQEHTADITPQTGRVLRGTVVKSAMKNTATVTVTRYRKDPKYKKYVRHMKKYLVHDPGNLAQVGEKVRIRETRPISKRKSFVIERT